MSKKNFYAVKNGRKTGIFDNWDECKKQIDEYSGAIYKSFKIYEDACEYLTGEIKNKIKNDNSVKEVEAYVDGSYSQELANYSYGCVILYGNEIIKFNGIGHSKEHSLMRNVAGELLGSMKAIEWAYENKCDLITIYYDYEGIERWANGTWKTKKQGTKEYSEFIKKHRQYLNIDFIKVKAHSGNVYNEEADRLAKEALYEVTEEMDYEEEHLDEKNKIFNKIMDMKETTKHSINIVFKTHEISDSKLKKFVKEVWKLEGNDISEIDFIDLNLDIRSSKLEWCIKDKQGEEHCF